MPPLTSPTFTIKQRVLTCLTKLSDRDTHSIAASELDSIARTLDQNAVPLFLSCIHSTDANDKSPVRKQCVRVVATLSEIHGNALSPYLNKLLTNLIRRFRDPDSAVRSACADAVAALSARVTKQPFSAFLKPLTDALFTEQDQHAQAAAAMCLAAAIDAAPDADPARLARLLPRFEKLVKCESFKAKGAVLALIGSVVEAGGASSQGALGNLVPCLVDALGSGDWAARKGAAEALTKLAVVERESLPEFKAGCMKVFENRRFDKVKLVREVMNQMLEAWKQIPDVSGDINQPLQSHASSKENASDGRYPPVSQNSCSPGSVMTKLRKRSTPVSRSTPPDRSSARTAQVNNSALGSSKRMSSGVLHKLNHKNWDVQISESNTPFKGIVDQSEPWLRDETVLERSKKNKGRTFKSEMKRALFDKNYDETKVHKFGGSKAGSRVVPFSEEIQESVPPVCNNNSNINNNNNNNVPKDLPRNDKESEELSLIRNQLLQIEKQQSSLLDLLQKFIGSSENGMRSLETRVHGLEIALDEISYDLALSSGRMTKSDAPRNSCCLLPGAEFLSSKFWRRTQGWYSCSRFSRSGCGTPSLAAIQYRTNNSYAETRLPNHRFRSLHGGGGGGFITNPLAEVNADSRGISGFARAEPV